MTETPKEKPTTLSIVAGPGGLQLNTFGDMWNFAGAVVKSGMAPKGLEKQEALVITMQLGAELGLGPMTAIQNICVINGRPTVWGDIMLGLCQSSGLFDEEAFIETMLGNPDSNDWAGCCSCRRLPSGNLVTHIFSVRDAKRAGLWEKKGPWQQYPQRMLQMRARSWALRDCFPDVLKGIYSGEEARDIVVETVPSDDHLAQAQLARGEEMAAEVVAEKDAVAESLFTVDVEHGYNESIENATFNTELVGLQIQITSHPSLTEEAKRRLTAKIAGRKVENNRPDADPGKVADLQPVAEEAELTSNGEERGYASVIVSTTLITDLDRFQGEIDANDILSFAARDRLTTLVKYRKEFIHGEETELTSDGEEAGYELAVLDSDSISGLEHLQAQVESDGILTDAAIERLVTAINCRQVVIRASRGSRSNEPKTD